MSDFFTRLASRTLGHTQTLSPASLSRFEPSATPEHSSWPTDGAWMPAVQTASPGTEESNSSPSSTARAEAHHQPSPSVDQRDQVPGPGPGPNAPAPPPATEALAPETRIEAPAPLQMPPHQREAPTSQAPAAVHSSQSARTLKERGGTDPESARRREPAASEEGPSSEASIRVRRASDMEPLMPVATDVARLPPTIQTGSRQAVTTPGGGSVAPIQVTIGRVEVRAVTPQPAPRRPPPKPTQPKLSLDDYVAQRREGQR